MGGSLGRLWLASGAAAVGAWWGMRSGRPAAGLALVAVAVGLLMLRRSPGARAIGLVLLACGVTASVAAARNDDGRALATLARDVPRCAFSGRVLEQSGGLGTVAAIDGLACDGDTKPGGTVILDGGDRVPSGSAISGTGWLLPLGDDEFGDARRSLGAVAVADLSDIEVSPPGSWFMRVAASLRRGLTNAARATGSRESALLLGLTIGDTSGFDDHTIDSFRRTGLSHLLAVSGSNVAMVLACGALLARRLPYLTRLVAGYGLLGLFVLIVGPDPSVLRAALMGGVAILAVGWTRRVDPLHSLGLALLVILIVRPGMVTSVGLHLSAAATLGIVLWAKPLAEKMTSFPRLVAIPLALTLAAQAAVAPILVATFGEVSLVAPLTNLIVGPAVWITTLCGLGAALLAPLSSVAARLLVRLATPALAWILYVADRGARVSWASATVGTAWVWPAGAAILVAVGWSVRKRVPGAS